MDFDEGLHLPSITIKVLQSSTKATTGDFIFHLWSVILMIDYRVFSSAMNSKIAKGIFDALINHKKQWGT